MPQDTPNEHIEATVSHRADLLRREVTVDRESRRSGDVDPGTHARFTRRSGPRSLAWLAFAMILAAAGAATIYAFYDG